MSEAAIGKRRPAFGHGRAWHIGGGRTYRALPRFKDHRVILPNAGCRLPVAILCAIPCTVTHSRTSVTTLALAESDLIIVGKANGRWSKTAAVRGFARAAHCSFQGGVCIQ